MLNTKLIYQSATQNDCLILTNIANSSKKYWGYSDKMMGLWKEELEINMDYINKNEVIKVLYDRQLIGFYALKFDNANKYYEIDHFWLLPKFMGKGFGKQIFQRIMKTLADKGQSKAIL
jgi:RimJ/RimL family protein N-acetyltransferase